MLQKSWEDFIMERKKINIIGIIYIALLFIVYEMMLRITGFSINTAVYGLFIILVFSIL